jgi:threonyl-tRNA synthetase
VLFLHFAALAGTGRAFEVQAGEGAFYGPKIDVVVKDAVGREHQCATLQLDFQLPIKFQLEFVDDSGSFQRPVMIHRAILGMFLGVVSIPDSP